MNHFFKLIVTGVLFIALTSFFWIFQTGVTITVDAPDIIEAGDEITVNVTINKGKLTGFARFQQELPVGFTARSENSANANFSFQDQHVRLNWLSLPAHDEIKFSYKIIANERLMGEIDLDGQFSFVDDNEGKTVNVQPKLLAINPSQNISAGMRVDVKDFGKIASIEAEALGSGQTVAFRQQPAWLEEDRVYLVTLLINKDAVRKFAKIEETVPEGYTATNLDSKGGIFEFSNQVARILWMDLPLEPYFMVTYKLIPNDGTPSTSMNISGLFTFMVNERTFESVIIERRETLASLTQQQVNQLVANSDIQFAEQQPMLAANTGSTPSQQTATTTPTTIPPSTPTTATATPPTTPTTIPPRPSTTTTTANNERFILRADQGIYYRVQISAGHRPVNIPVQFRNHRLDVDVMREDHEGWYKYTVGAPGQFRQYSEARDYRVHISNTTPANDAFVVAYNDGRRISVQDALMALNQRWIR